MLAKDYLEMIDLLNSHDVDFVVVGAYAMSAFGYTRATGDIDLFVKPDSANAGKLMEVLAQFGAPLQGISSKDFIKPGTVFQIGVAPVRIDILTSIDGIAFDEIKPERKDIGGIEAPLIDLNSLLQNKRATGRLRDLADCEELEKRNAKARK